MPHAGVLTWSAEFAPPPGPSSPAAVDGDLSTGQILFRDSLQIRVPSWRGFEDEASPDGDASSSC